ncbi:MAG: leucine-rich repeat protein [Saprospiraceae bacterium]|nr:leucine-rich repeat protein [Saprospiraceae bacterium]
MNPGITKTIVFDNPGTCVSIPPPCPSEIYYTKQTQVDLFPLTYPSCKVIEGSVTIRQSTLPGAQELENLSGFSNLEYIQGNVTIERTNLSDLKGLELLKNIGGDLSIYNNPKLKNLEGMNNLESVGKTISIFDCTEINSLSGLESLNQIGVDLLLQFVPALNDLSALANLSNVNGSLWLQYCEALSSLEGLDNISNIGSESDLFSGLLAIIACPSLENIEYLAKLKSISSLILQGNTQLKSLAGFEGLDSIRQDLMIMNNPQIENLDALSNVKSTLKQFLYLEDNKLLANLSGIRNIKLDSLIQLEISGSESLSACSVPNICEYLDNGGQARIEYNKFGCNTSGEIQSVCEVPLTAYLEGGTFICQGDSTELIITFEGVSSVYFYAGRKWKAIAGNHQF